MTLKTRFLVTLTASVLSTLLHLSLIMYHLKKGYKDILNNIRSSEYSIIYKLCSIFTLLAPLSYIVSNVIIVIICVVFFYPFGLYSFISCNLLIKLIIISYYIGIILLHQRVL